MRRYLLILLLLSSSGLFSQQYSFIRYGVKDGLAQSQVTDICQDNLGYLWVGTQSGLSKFDGIEFTNFSIDNGLTDNTIHKLLFSSEDDILWIATPKGITEYKNHKFIAHPFETNQKVNDLLIFNNSLYIATNNGLIIYKNGTFKHYPSYFKIRQFAKKNNSTILCASNEGLFEYSKRQFTLHDDTLVNKLNYSGIYINNDQLILSTYGQGIFSYNLKNGDVSPYPAKYKSVKGIYANNKEIWGLGSFGLIQIQQDSLITYYSEENGLTINLTKRIFQDRENNIWIATYGKGLLKFSGKSIMSYTTQDGLPSDIVMSINENNSGEFTFGTYNKGMVMKDGLKMKTYTSDNGLNHNSVWSILHSNNTCWVGTTNGVNYINNNTIAKDEIITGKIRSIYAINDSLIFFGGKSGLWAKLNNKYTHFISKDNFDINKIYCSKSKIYLATKNGLYWQFLNKLTEGFNKIELDEENCNTMVMDSYGNIWVGTINGLFIISPDNNKREYYLDKSNFKAKNILGALLDLENNIWLSTANGIYLLMDENPFDSKRLVSYHYSDAEGVIDLESNLNALFEDSQGKIWVGTSSALIRIDPKLNPELFTYSKPQLSISSIKLFQEYFNYQQYSSSFDTLTLVPNEIKLPHNKNHLTFDFIGINLKNPRNIKYSYRLLGAEDIWSPLSNNKSATYSFISPGDYEFQLKATNDGSNWTDIKSVKISILPPFWKTWWFISLLLLFSTTIIYLIFQVRIKSIKQKKDNEKLKYKNRLRDLEQQSLNASMNRHFIFNSLNSIQYFINSSDKLSANRYLSSFAKLIRKNLDSSTADNFIVNLEEEIERIKLYLTLEKMRFGEKFDYTINLDPEIDTEMTNVPSMILQPFVENSIIHGVLPLDPGVKGHIDINIKQELNSITFEVIDDGVGIDNSLKLKSAFTGDHESKGMIITANRIELLRKINGEKLMIIGPFQINNESGESTGTKVIIKIPTNEN